MKVFNMLIIFAAKYLFILSVLIAGIYFLLLSIPKKKEFSVFTVIALPFTYVLAKLSSLFIFDPRPFVTDHITPLIAHASDNGFPSDHMLLTTAIASVVFVYNRWLGLLLFGIALAVGISRVIAGVHHPLDIIGSVVLAVISTAVVYFSTVYLKKRQASSHESV